MWIYHFALSEKCVFLSVIFEKNSPLKTLLPTGGGRCNLAHAEFDLKELASNYPRGEKFLYSVFSRFGTSETLEFFEKIGIGTYIQDDMRIFPVSDKASDVRNAMLEAINGVKIIKENVVLPVLEEYENKLKKDVDIIINPSGKFTIWGSFGDSGCVGRKIIVDSYGGVSHVGGGCFSSKNATKIDRSGAYYARYVAKNVVASGLANECEIQASYAIGLPKPLSLNIDCFKTNKVTMEEIYDFVEKNFDFSVANIINELGLLEPIYAKTACYGHFGREEFPWEKIKNF